MANKLAKIKLKRDIHHWEQVIKPNIEQYEGFTRVLVEDIIVIYKNYYAQEVLTNEDVEDIIGLSQYLEELMCGKKAPHWHRLFVWGVCILGVLASIGIICLKYW